VRFVLLAIVALAVAACGQLKSRDDKTLVVRQSNLAGGEGGQAEAGSEEREIRRFAEYMKLYFTNGGVDREGLVNVFERHWDKFEKFLEGSTLTPRQVAEVLFKLNADGDSQVSLKEVNDALERRIPTMGWLGSARCIGARELDARAREHFPGASDTARAGDVAAL
jgi:hypothetical protein